MKLLSLFKNKKQDYIPNQYSKINCMLRFDFKEYLDAHRKPNDKGAIQK